MNVDLQYAQQLDAQDELAHFRHQFLISDPDLIYLDGNSLGRLPKAAVTHIDDLVHRQWGDRLIRSWNEGWFELPERIGGKIAQLIGARPNEVIVADSTSVNFFKLVVTALRAQAGRTEIISDAQNFPSDLYIAQGVIELLGNTQLQVTHSSDDIHGAEPEIKRKLNDKTALLTLSHTLFKSGYVYDMAELTAAAHAAGALVLWDLSHSVGAVPVDLNGCNVDLAVGCSYKYLNGGPGAPAFLYIRRDLQEKLSNPISGWMGQRNLFDLALQYTPTSGLRHFLTGTAPILSLAPIEAGVDLLLEAGMERLRAKSVAQTEYLIGLWEAILQPLGFTLNSPRDAAQRGSHVSLGHAEGLRIDLALIHDMKVLPDFRRPDNIRIGIAPIYTSFVDIHTAIMRMKQVVEEKIYEKYPKEAPKVT
ncbi:MAG: kynureninase [Caldilineaceae bacterium]